MLESDSDQMALYICSLVASIYSVIYIPKAFKDVEKHWAREAVNDMASRLVVSGVGEERFEPDREITRAEFAAIAVRALGLMRPGTGKDVFNKDNITRAEVAVIVRRLLQQSGLI